MWTKRFGVWCRSRPYGAARGVETAENSWDQSTPPQPKSPAPEISFAKENSSAPAKPQLHMVAPEPSAQLVEQI
jgi:hypothetical protein